MLEQQTLVMVKIGTVWFGINQILCKFLSYIYLGYKQLISFCYGVTLRKY